VIWLVAFLNVLSSGGFVILINDPTTGGNGINPYTLLATCLALGAMAFTFSRVARHFELRNRAMFLIMIATLPFVSMLWAPVYLLTFRSALTFASSNFVALATALYFTPNDVVRISIKAAVISAIASLLVVFLVPAAGTHAPGHLYATTAYAGAWRGIFVDKNILGAAMSINILLVLTAKRSEFRSQAVRLLLILMSSLLLFFSRSASPILFGISSIIVTSAAFRGFAPPATRITYRIALVPLAALALFVFTNQDLFQDVLSRDMTLTGRVPFWLYIIDHLNNPLWLGLGYYSGWHYYFALDVDNIFGPAFVNAHNGYLEVYVNFGLLGISIYLLWVIQTYRSAARLTESGDANLCCLGRISIVLMTLFLLLSSTESYVINVNPISHTVLLFSAAAILNRKRAHPAPGLIEHRLRPRYLDRGQ
jgi:exopolysaccharide production protein ExoQ